jgi:hypothetical protein
MHRRVLSLAAFAVLVTACAKAPTTPTVAIPERPAPPARAPIAAAEAAPTEVPALVKNPGDYVVLRFSGSFRKSPATLTQRVLSRDGDTIVVELTLAEGKKTETLRARIQQIPGGGEEVLDAVRVIGGKEHAAGPSAYDAMLARTMPDVDANEETLSTESDAVDLGGRKITGKRTRYRVVAYGREATMSILHADGFAWGDVAGEIVGPDGQVIYKAEVLDLGSGGRVASGD